MPCAVANPLLLIVATLLFEELKVTESVMSTWLPLSKVPVAVYCWVSLEVIVASVGVMVIELRFPTVTETVVEPLMVADVAFTLAVPA